MFLCVYIYFIPINPQLMHTVQYITLTDIIHIVLKQLLFSTKSKRKIKYTYSYKEKNIGSPEFP